jgi:hypothetical protein
METAGREGANKCTGKEEARERERVTEGESYFF